MLAANVTNMDVISRAASVLGFSCLNDKQKEVISQFVAGNDVFVCLPTGFGKSICLPIKLNFGPVM